MADTDSHTQLQSIQNNVDDIRSLTLCKVCLRPFYEPFILICGHTFCYGCLRSWFCGGGTRRKHRNCPECRTVIKTLPAPNYALRDLAHMFIDRQELLPEDESTIEHERGKAEEARLLSTDRKGAGLFQGVFKRHDMPFPLGPIRDFDDGVDRCPTCGWEIEDMGHCHRCGWHDINHDFSDQASSDEDERLDNGDDITYDIDSDLENELHPIPQFYDIHSDADDTTAGTDDYGTPRPHDYNEDDEDDMDDFVTDDDDQPDETDFDADDWNRQAALGVFQHDADDNDEGEITDSSHDPVIRSYHRRNGAAPRAISIPSDDDETDGDDEDDDEEGLVRNTRFNRVISDDDDDVSDDDSVAGEGADYTALHRNHATFEEQANADDSDRPTIYDESDEEIQPRPAHHSAQIPQIFSKRRRLVVPSDDDDDDESTPGLTVNDRSATLSDQAPRESTHMGWQDSSDDSDDSIPPQTAAQRMHRLNAHQAARARRSTPDRQRSTGSSLSATLSGDRMSRNSSSSGNQRRSSRPWTTRVY